MYNFPVLVEKFTGIFGIHNAYDPSYPRLATPLTESLSGFYLQDIHPLCTVENIVNCGPEFGSFEYEEWESKNYNAGDIVTQDGKVYVAFNQMLVGTPSPASGLAQWEETDLFNAWLIRTYNGAIRQAFVDLLRHKRLEESNKQLLDSLILFDGIGNYASRIIKRNRFCGLSFTLSRQEGLRVIIDKIAMQLTDEQGPLTLYLYHDSQAEPVATIPLNFTRSGSFQWLDVENVIAEYIAANSAGGRYYLGYYEADLVGQAIKRDSTWGVAPCMGCTGWNYEAYGKWSKHVNVTGFHVTDHYYDTDVKSMFDPKNVYFDADTNWGINLAVTVDCDLTQFFVKNRFRLALVVGMSFAIKMLEMIGYTTRLNAVPDQVKMLALKDLSVADEDSFINKYIKEIKSVSVDFAGMSSDCMPKANNIGIKMGAV